ncbi:50S ribosomal protein L5 [Candidatus Kaiserbacteria bacterium]|nr:50S ribosomal protein L5 [Candidatus Kaiserbacteria bacterium]
MAVKATTVPKGKTLEKVSGAYNALKEASGYTNAMQAPRIEKVVVGVGIGRVSDKTQRELIADRLARITGQRPVACGAKQSIASFKLRQGDIVGYQTTLRGPRMYHFLDKLIHVALPRTRDFRGIRASSVDEMGNCTIGIREHTIFPETSDEDLRNVFGLGITIVTTARTKKDALALLRHIGVPLEK